MKQDKLYRMTFIIVKYYFYIYSHIDDKFLLNLNKMKQSNLFKWLKTIPKSVLQHNHFNCNEDFDFVINLLIKLV